MGLRNLEEPRKVLNIHVQPTRDITEPTRSVTSRARVCESDRLADILKRNRLPHTKLELLDNHMRGETGITSRDLDDDLKSIFVYGSRSRSRSQNHKLGGTLQSYRNHQVQECTV